MSRWKELIWTLGANILFPRFCLFVLLPVLFVVPTSLPLPWSYRGLPPVWAGVVVAGSFLVFGVSVAANLGISRCLRRHEMPDSPYKYACWYEASRRSSYFRIQVFDLKAFRHLLQELRRDHPCEAIGWWLCVDDFIYTPPVLLLLVPMLLFLLVLWLAKLLRDKLWPSKPHPTSWH